MRFPYVAGGMRWLGIGLLFTVLTTAPRLARAESVMSMPIVVPAAAPVAEAQPRYLYLMSKPLPLDVQLGKIAKALHYIYWGVEIAAKTGGFYAATESVAPTVGFFAFTLGHSVPYLTAHSMIDIKLRQWLRSSWMARKLRDIPGVQRAIILSSGVLGFSGLMVTERKSLNYVFVETTEPLRSEGGWTEVFGQPIDLRDSARARISFRLSIDGQVNPFTWEAPLVEILDKKPMPVEVAELWRAHVKEWDKESKLISKKDHFLGKHNRAVRVDATLTLPEGQAVPLDAVISGSQVRRLLGLKWYQRAQDAFAEFIGRRKLVERAMPLSTKRFPLKQCERILNEQ
jgi:hypothetical protein